MQKVSPIRLGAILSYELFLHLNPFMRCRTDDLTDRANGELIQMFRRKKPQNYSRRVSRACSPIDMQRVEQALLRIDEGPHCSPEMEPKGRSENMHIVKYFENLHCYHTEMREFALKDTSMFVLTAQLDV